MNIEKNKVVSLNYKLTIFDQDLGKDVLVEETNDKHPFVFIFGTGSLLDSFESKIKDLIQGDSFDFTLKSNEAYGVIQSEQPC